MIPARIREYIDFVRSGGQRVCQDQLQLVALVERAFASETLRYDNDQAERYLKQQKHFPFRLMSWEVFVFLLHNCVYKANGQLRWPRLAIVVGRGAGKNGYLAFEDFCLLTPVNGVKNYNIDIFATSEDQAKTTFQDVWNILEGNPNFFSKYFSWTKEEIVNLATGSVLRYHTSSAKTKDGGRPGKVDFDEYHAYENSKLVDVAVTGLGKKSHPRRTIITTMGNVRGGLLDKLMDRAEQVLAGEKDDGGWLYFICRLDTDDEIDDPEMWGKANPSLYDPTRPELLAEILEEYSEYREDPAGHADFATKRMNRPRSDLVNGVTSWENILAASQPLPPMEALAGRLAVGAIDYASTQDFVSAGVLVPMGGMLYWYQHTWICAQSSTLSYVKFPIPEAQARGECTIVDAVEIPPELPVAWLAEWRGRVTLLLAGIDHYRFTLLSRAFAAYGFDPDRENGNLKLTYTPEQSMVAPLLSSAFVNHSVAWGDCMIMRWFTNNATRMLDKRGNITFGKIEPKSRKTDGFMALVMAFICYQLKQDIFEIAESDTGELPDVAIY